jgi:hypothetical protein
MLDGSTHFVLHSSLTFMEKLSRSSLQPLLAALILIPLAAAQWQPHNPVTGVQQQPDGILVTQKTGTLKIQVCSDSIFRDFLIPGVARLRGREERLAWRQIRCSVHRQRNRALDRRA